jgi:hypothetical protein
LIYLLDTNGIADLIDAQPQVTGRFIGQMRAGHTIGLCDTPLRLKTGGFLKAQPPQAAIGMKHKRSSLVVLW